MKRQRLREHEREEEEVLQDQRLRGQHAAGRRVLEQRPAVEDRSGSEEGERRRLFDARPGEVYVEEEEEGAQTDYGGLFSIRVSVCWLLW